MTLATLLGAMAPGRAGGWTLDLPDDWTQGRTAYGGLTAALCLEAVHRALPGLPPLRAAQVAFVGPASGRLTLAAELVRQGRSASVAQAALEGGRGPAARALFTFGAERPSRTTHTRCPLPAVPAAGALPPRAGAMPPAFARHFDMRWASGDFPLSGPRASPAYRIWARLLDGGDARADVALLALGDSPPPAAMSGFAAPAPISSMSWSLDLCTRPGEPGAWHLIEGESLHAAGGYSAQAMRLWREDGALVALASQTVALFDAPTPEP